MLRSESPSSCVCVMAPAAGSWEEGSADRNSRHEGCFPSERAPWTSLALWVHTASVPDQFYFQNILDPVPSSSKPAPWPRPLPAFAWTSGAPINLPTSFLASLNPLSTKEKRAHSTSALKVGMPCVTQWPQESVQLLPTPVCLLRPDLTSSQITSKVETPGSPQGLEAGPSPCPTPYHSSFCWGPFKRHQTNDDKQGLHTFCND